MATLLEIVTITKAPSLLSVNTGGKFGGIHLGVMLQRKEQLLAYGLLSAANMHC